MIEVELYDHVIVLRHPHETDEFDRVASALIETLAGEGLAVFDAQRDRFVDEDDDAPPSWFRSLFGRVRR